MKKTRLILSAVLAFALVAFVLAGCSACAAPEVAEEDGTFSYSSGLDENGRWKDITATDYVTMFEYEALEIPADVHEITDEAVEEKIQSTLSNYSTQEEVSDRPAQDGDTLNIDYVGTIDGVEFEGGNTEGAGTEVTIGTSTYIDDFIEQLIGHNTGENFDIEVTFPEDYGNEELNGKDAVFNVTINAISETIVPELNDEFVATNLAETNGWTTVDDMRKGVYEDLQENAILTYVQEYLATEVEVSSIPESILAYQEDAMAAYYESYASMYGVELEEFLTSYVGAESMEALLEESQEDIRKSAVYSLAVQAVAEDAGIEITDEDVAAYFEEYFDSADYSSYEEQYGLPYLKQTAMSQRVLDFIVENAVLA